MYNDTIKVANKIISQSDLSEIFSVMYEKLDYYQKIYRNEEMKNKMLDYRYQEWTFKDNGSSLKMHINFYDDTNVFFDNYNNFITIFNNRLKEIKDMSITFALCYNVQTNQGGNYKSDYYSQSISMQIYESKASIDVKVSSEDKKIDDVYELIKNKILNAPERYNRVIKKRKRIVTTIGLAMGFIPAIILSTLLLFFPEIRHVIAASYVLYPISCIFIAVFFSNFIGPLKMNPLYKNIVPEKIYVGYNNGPIYKDDIEKYMETSEILIGKNVYNLECRRKIEDDYNKYRKFILYEIGTVIVISVLLILLNQI